MYYCFSLLYYYQSGASVRFRPTKFDLKKSIADFAISEIFRTFAVMIVIIALKFMCRAWG